MTMVVMSPDLTEVQVGPFTYSLVWSTSALTLIGVEKKRNFQGYTDHFAQTITIRDDMPRDSAQDTLLHEIIHCVWASTGMYQREAIAEEEVAASISPMLLQAFRDNPRVMEFLTS